MEICCSVYLTIIIFSVGILKISALASCGLLRRGRVCQVFQKGCAYAVRIAVTASLTAGFVYTTSYVSLAATLTSITVDNADKDKLPLFICSLL